MSHNRQYPTPEDLDASTAHRVAADQQRHADWVVSGNRTFLLNVALGAAVLALVVKDIVFHANFTPAVEYVQFEGGKVVLFKPDSSVVMDSLEYHPYRLRQVVSDFTQRRYAYDHRNLGYVLDALRLMTTEARDIEVSKIRSLDLNSNVTQRGLRVQVTLQENQMKVVATEKGRFRVTIPATIDLLYQDGTSGSGEVNTRTTTFDYEVVAVRENVAPLGYLINATGENRVW